MPTMATQRMNDLLALSHVPRWGIVRTARQQSVADHSFRVAVIAHELYIRLLEKRGVGPGAEETGELLLWALMHDGGESHTGDLPGHIKNGSPEMRTAVHHIEQRRCQWLTSQPPPFVRCVVKIADVMESLTFIWMNKQGTHADWVWRYLNNQMVAIVNSCCPALGMPAEAVWLIVQEMVGDIQTEKGRTYE